MSDAATPTREQVRAAVEAHFRLWNADDREAWLANFAADVTFDDPVGAPTKHGREAVEKSWDHARRDGQKWRLEPHRIVVCGDEAAVLLTNHGIVDGETVTVEGIEIWRVGADGRIVAVRAYFEPDFEIDPYFSPERFSPD